MKLKRKSPTWKVGQKEKLQKFDETYIPLFACDVKCLELEICFNCQYITGKRKNEVFLFICRKLNKPIQANETCKKFSSGVIL